MKIWCAIVFLVALGFAFSVSGHQPFRWNPTNHPANLTFVLVFSLTFFFVGLLPAAAYRLWKSIRD